MTNSRAKKKPSAEARLRNISRVINANWSEEGMRKLPLEEKVHRILFYALTAKELGGRQSECQNAIETNGVLKVENERLRGIVAKLRKAKSAEEIEELKSHIFTLSRRMSSAVEMLIEVKDMLEGEHSDQ